MDQADISKVKKHFETLKNDRMPFDTMYQALSEYISMMKQSYNGDSSSTSFLMNEIYDSSGAYAAVNSAAALTGMLWAGSALQSIYIEEPQGLESRKDIASYYEYFLNKLAIAFDDPKANFTISFDEYMLDQIIYGTSGIGVESGEESLLMFKPYGIRELYIEEGKNGQVVAVYLLFNWKIDRIVGEYGLENVSEKVQDKFKNNKLNDEEKILICIRKRKEKKAKLGVLSMPYESLHIEFNQDHLLKESGYSDLPIKVGRFRKLNYERYGRSNGMFALPDIKEANILREAVILATEKNLDPPLGVLSSGDLGGGVIDTSAGAISVINATSSLRTQPVFPLVTVGSINDALVRLEKLEQTISQHFYIDRLLDFNNETQMTFGEAKIRAGLRAASLSSLFSRQISEVLSPVIDRAVNILFQMGELGVVRGSDMHLEREANGKEYHLIPDVLVERMAAGQDIYKVSYKTQASQAARSEEYLSILDVASTAIQFSQVDPRVGVRLNLDKAIQALSNIRGVRGGIIREDDEVDAIMEANQRAQQEQVMLAAAQQGADIVDKMASASKTARE